MYHTYNVAISLTPHFARMFQNNFSFFLVVFVVILINYKHCFHLEVIIHKWIFSRYFHEFDMSVTQLKKLINYDTILKFKLEFHSVYCSSRWQRLSKIQKLKPKILLFSIHSIFGIKFKTNADNNVLNNRIIVHLINSFIGSSS